MVFKELLQRGVNSNIAQDELYWRMNLNHNMTHCCMLKAVYRVILQVFIKLNVWGQCKQLMPHVIAVAIGFEEVQPFIIMLLLESTLLKEHHHHGCERSIVLKDGQFKWHASLCFVVQTMR